MVEPGALRAGDVAVLRRELALRIALQNLLLLLTVVVFCAFAITALVVPQAGWPAAAACGVAVLALSLQWCHHGVRTMNIKAYLMQIDPGAGPDGDRGWESWLPANRPRSLLGSRWMVSTKGVFMGTQGAMILLVWQLGTPPDPVFAAAALGLLLVSAGFLLTNPKE